MTPCIIALDFDGTCVRHEYPRIGADIGAVPVLKALTRRGFKIILWTMRSGPGLDAAVGWFTKHGIPLFGVQTNPQQKEWTDSPKAYANLYIDDAGLGIPLIRPEGERPYVDWAGVSGLLLPDVEGCEVLPPAPTSDPMRQKVLGRGKKPSTKAPDA